MIRTRFAPSPTGSLHVGNARVAVLNWLFTRRHHGTLILRIEDTDLERHDAASEAGILRDLAWLGIDIDEGPGQGAAADFGDAGPYRQSERARLYHERAAELRRADHTYDCYCDPDAPGSRSNCACAALDATALERFRASGREPAMRFRVRPGATVVRDAVRGEVRFENVEITDFVILRADGRPTYNFAVVVDDVAMRITHVIRGAGHLSNTPRQVMLYDAFGAEPPAFVHVPTVLGPDRQKLSKRHGARSLADYRNEGYHPDGLINYLSLLSWSSPNGEEVLERSQLIEQISLDRIGVADVVFDPAKLDWLSAKHIEKMPLDALVSALEPFARAAGWLAPAASTQTEPGRAAGSGNRDVDSGATESAKTIAREVFPEAVDAVRTHLSRFGDIARELTPYFPPEEGRDHEDVALDLSVLTAAHEHLSASSEWTAPRLQAAVKAASQAAGVRGRALYEPLRLVLTGRMHGPPFVAVLRVQGRERVLNALSRAIGQVRTTG